jgi:NADH dehydrogenase
MKTIPQALNIRSFILENFEQAVLTTDVVDQNSLINFVLVGGGPTRGISRCFSRDEKAILQKIIQILIFQNANQPYSKW